MEAALSFEQWNLDFQEAVAAIEHARATIRRGAGLAGIAFRLWDAARVLKRVVRMMESLEGADLSGLLPEVLRNSAATGRRLHAAVSDLLETSARKRLTNRSLTGGSLESIRKSGEEILEFAERLSIRADPDLPAIIEQSIADYRRGETVSLEDLR